MSDDRPRSPRRESMRARALVGLAELPTIVAVGPFSDLGHAEQLGAAFIAVLRSCTTQLVLLGTGAHRGAVVRQAADCSVQSRVHLVADLVEHRRSMLLAAADVVVPSPASGTGMLLDLMAVGRAVAAPAIPAAARLIVPAGAGLFCWPGGVSAMTAAILRLLSAPMLRDEMATRAGQVTERQDLCRAKRRHFNTVSKGNEHA
ncbi:MAG TPA: glycosyltransferase [Mycobacterium sp.]|nr:glycosyltransferase [Mycobacterium sp.]